MRIFDRVLSEWKKRKILNILVILVTWGTNIIVLPMLTHTHSQHNVIRICIFIEIEASEFVIYLRIIPTEFLRWTLSAVLTYSCIPNPQSQWTPFPFTASVSVRSVIIRRAANTKAIGTAQAAEIPFSWTVSSHLLTTDWHWGFSIMRIYC